MNSCVFLRFFILVCLLFAQFAWAEVSVEIKGKDVFVTESGNKNATEPVLIGKVKTFKKGVRLFHWGSEEEIERWLKQGHIDSNELDFLISQFEGQAAGGGLLCLLGFTGFRELWSQNSCH